MNTKREIKLNYTEEFKIGCKLNNLTHEELLQYFVDHVSFYAFIGGNMEQVYLWATNVCIDCKELMGGAVEVVTDQRVQEISLKYIKKLTGLSQESDMSKSNETIKSIMKAWAAEMLPVTDYLINVTLDSEESLTLSFDFNLLCRMNGISVQVLLQYFIDHISLARERAVNLHDLVKTDPSTAVLLLLVSSHEELKDRIMPYQHIYKQYGLKLLRLDKKQEQIESLETRIINYNTLYREWYRALYKDIN